MIGTMSIPPELRKLLDSLDYHTLSLLGVHILREELRHDFVDAILDDMKRRSDKRMSEAEVRAHRGDDL